MVSAQYDGRVRSFTDYLGRGSLSKEQRIKYTKAVRCLQTTPNVFSNTRVPGARSRFDDVVAIHIFQAPFIHFSVGSFYPLGFPHSQELTWHDRVSSYRGTATTPTSTISCFVQNAAIPALSHTGTGHSPTKIPESLKYLMARLTLWAATASPSPITPPM